MDGMKQYGRDELLGSLGVVAGCLVVWGYLSADGVSPGWLPVIAGGLVGGVIGMFVSRRLP
ncbi:MAG: hypothetical protein U9R40_07905 [Synergistota bacterium]|nr:hypothetical protein [Synergistota bacterium]